MTPYYETTTAPARECGCPDYVIQCIHWDGRIVFVTDSRNLPETHLRHYGGLHDYAVGSTAGFDIRACPCGCRERGWKSDGFIPANVRYSNYADALAAFHEQEARLLRGDA